MSTLEKTLIVILMILTIGWSGTLYYYTAVKRPEPTITPFNLWTANSLTRIFENTPPQERPPFLKIKAAQNEYECAQIVITANRDLHSLKVDTVDLKDNQGNSISKRNIKLNFVGFITVPKNTPDTPEYELERKAPCRIPDPLLEVKSINLKSGKSQPIWISIYVPKGTPPGEYRGVVKISCEEGEDEIPLTLEVLPFELPDERHLLVTNWFSIENIAKAHKVELWSDKFFSILAKYAEIMAEHRQNVVFTPWSLVKVYKEEKGLSFDFSLFDKYVEIFMNAGVSDRIEIFHVAHPKSGWGSEVVLSEVTAIDKKTGEQIKLSPQEGLGPLLTALQNHLEEKGWLNKTMIHVSDEPSISNMDSWKRASQFVAKFAPKIRRIDAIESTDLLGYLEVWVPKLNYFTTWGEIYEEARKNGIELWFYTCCTPTGFFPNRFLDYPLVKTRVLHWINYAYNLKGYLHWGLNWWDDNPFGEPDPELPPGDTHIIYPGENGPLSSIRFDVMRDGIEDYEYLLLLEKKMKEVKDKLGDSALEFDPKRRSIELCRKIVRSLTDYGSASDLLKVRDEIIQEIISADKRPLAIIETYPKEGTELVPGPIIIEVRGVTEDGVHVKIDGDEVQVKDGKFKSFISVDQEVKEIIIEISKGEYKKTIKRRFIVKQT